MRHLHIDIETYSAFNLKDGGVYRYAQDPSFEIILFAYAWGDEEPTVLDLTGDKSRGYLPDDVETALTNPAVLKIAHNANFEMVCISEYFGITLNPAQWFCTMVGAAYLGLPHSLDQVGKVLNLANQKDSKGKALITYFCTPCKPTKRNGGRTRNNPHHDPEKWELFKEYNAQDVRTEQEIFDYLQRFPVMPAIEWAYWQQDQQINTRGVQVDPVFIDAAIEANLQFLQGVHAELKKLTGVDNPNSLAQLKAWIHKEGATGVSTLNKETIEDLLKEPSYLPWTIKRALVLRQLGSKTSVSKYDAMKSYMCYDGRIRGLLQFYGANRTGRFAGRGVQVQNLKRTIGKGLEVAREAVVKGVVDLLYDDVPEVISTLVRTALIAGPGRSLVSCDFSAIEARVVAWLAGEEWQLDVFRTHGKLYEATAAKMFSLPLDSITKDLRQKGKVAALALGYQGGAGALVTMGALRQGLTEGELPAIVRAWRSANPAIVALWREVEESFRRAVQNRSCLQLNKPYTSLVFSYNRGYLFITLPSGRRLAYYGATVKDRKLSYYGVDQTKKTWTKIDTYGGSLVENIVQAIARDCLVDAMHRLRHLDIVMHVHDEIVSEQVDERAHLDLEEMKNVMSVSPSWGVGLPLSGAGYVSKYYKKD